MIDVRLNENLGKQMVQLIIGLAISVNQKNTLIANQVAAREQAIKTIKEQRSFFDNRYNATKQFFLDPVNSKVAPVIKKSYIEQIDRISTVMQKNFNQINSYNSNLLKIKQQALFRGLRKAV